MLFNVEVSKDAHGSLIGDGAFNEFVVILLNEIGMSDAGVGGLDFVLFTGDHGSLLDNKRFG